MFVPFLFHNLWPLHKFCKLKFTQLLENFVLRIFHEVLENKIVGTICNPDPHEYPIFPSLIQIMHIARNNTFEMQKRKKH